MAVVLGTLEFRPIIAVHGDHGALEAVPHVAHVREELQILWYSVEINEEAGEQDDRDRHHGSDEHSTLRTIILTGLNNSEDWRKREIVCIFLSMCNEEGCFYRIVIYFVDHRHYLHAHCCSYQQTDGLRDQRCQYAYI